jgi:hypothetical protein
MNQTDLNQAAKIIDRLLILLPTRDYHAVDQALSWLREHDHPGLVLSVATRDLMTR